MSRLDGYWLVDNIFLIALFFHEPGHDDDDDKDDDNDNAGGNRGGQQGASVTGVRPMATAKEVVIAINLRF